MPDKDERSQVNWTPIGVGLIAIGGLFLVWKIIQGLSNPEDQEQARLVIADWQQEWDELQPYVETIYANGRTPTEGEIAQLSIMTDKMKTKEELTCVLSRTVFDQLIDLIETIARNWWLAPVAVITPIAGYGTYRLIKGWKNRRQPPPNFPCPKCGLLYATEGSLKYHVNNEHTVTTAHIIEAQEAFRQTSTWVQASAAVEGVYARTYSNWGVLSPSEFKYLNWGIVSTIVYGIGALAEAGYLTTAISLLLI